MLEAVRDLRENYDHVFLTPEGAEHFAGVFGVPVHTYLAKDNPDDPKGLRLDPTPGGTPRTVAKGVGAHELAAQVCRGLGVSFPIKMGRGSQLRACCAALEGWLKEEAVD
jgi:hypothetical protein